MPPCFEVRACAAPLTEPPNRFVTSGAVPSDNIFVDVPRNIIWCFVRPGQPYPENRGGGALARLLGCPLPVAGCRLPVAGCRLLGCPGARVLGSPCTRAPEDLMFDAGARGAAKRALVLTERTVLVICGRVGGSVRRLWRDGIEADEGDYPHQACQ